ncbi:HD domain-containing protein, partial [Pseudorhodobacter sp.]|uniref:HD domain-containing protein n=1 Tax=Pseudorhodobacter sp. TaxID=1934400 RepID=UPI00264777AE
CEFGDIAHIKDKRKSGEPYITHPIAVAEILAGFRLDRDTIIAAILHDTVEDCAVSEAELVTRFGAQIAGIVAELTDNKALEKAERKRLQTVHAPGKSPAAALVKICDKMSNIRAVEETPPVHWDVVRQIAYLDWAESVVELLPAGADPARQEFAKRLRDARAAVAARA